MKKICFMILVLVSSMVVFVFKDSIASSEIPGRKNFLSLSNLLLSSNDQYFAKTILPIEVTPYLPYTLVLSKEFIGDHYDSIHLIQVRITYLPDYQDADYSFTVDSINQRVYFEFTSNSSQIHLENIPMKLTNYNAIMYQGTYADFNGYEPFLHPNDILDYYGVIPVNYDDLLTLSDLKAQIRATDPYHQGIELILEYDGYTTTNQLPGTYQVVFQAKYNQIVKRYHLEVVVYDITKPVISPQETILVPLSEKVDLADLLSSIIITDNVDEITYEDLVILQDTYTSATEVGMYYVLIEATDNSQNSSTLKIDIELIDRKPPVISGPPAIFVYTTDAPLTTAFILSLFEIIDDVDGTNVTVTWMKNDYMQNQSPGIYQMTIEANDTQLNSSTKDISIHVIDNRGPIFESNQMVFEVLEHAQMTNQDIIDWFIEQATLLGINASHVHVLYNEYELSNQSEGDYYVYLSYLLDGVETTSRITVNVTSQQSSSRLIYYGLGTALIVSSLALIIIKKKKI